MISGDTPLSAAMVRPVTMGDIRTTCPMTMAWGVNSRPRSPSGPLTGQGDEDQQADKDRGHAVEGLDEVHQRALAGEVVEVYEATDGDEDKGCNQGG